MEPMTDQTNIERIVMQRVRLIRVLRLIISTAVLALLTGIATLWGIGREVWVARVFQNAPAALVHLPDFFVAAFVQTRFIVQVLAVFTLASFLYLIVEITRLFVDVLKPARS